MLCDDIRNKCHGGSASRVCWSIRPDSPLALAIFVFVGFFAVCVNLTALANPSAHFAACGMCHNVPLCGFGTLMIGRCALHNICEV